MKAYPSRRERIPDPRCRHTARERRVTDNVDSFQARASCWVCARPECVADAKDWVETLTGADAIVFDQERKQVAP